MIRKATHADHAWLMEQFKEFTSEHGLDQFGAYDFEYINAEMLPSFIDKHLVLVAEHEGQLAGMLVAMIRPGIYNPKQIVATELAWWVPKNFRNTRAGAALLATFIGWGKRNVDRVVMSTLATSPVNPASMLKRGFSARQLNWVMENKNG